MSVIAYKPANGVEGRLFEDELCSRCTKGVNSQGCLIMVDQYYCETIEDPDYPPQLVRDGEAASCLDFDDKYDEVILSGQQTIEVTGNVVEVKEAGCPHLTEDSWLTVEQTARELSISKDSAVEFLVSEKLLRIAHLTRQELSRWGDVIAAFRRGRLG